MRDSLQLWGNDVCSLFLLALVGPQHVWSESEDCLPFLQLAQDYISSCGKKTLHEVLEKVFKSFRPVGSARLLKPPCPPL